MVPDLKVFIGFNYYRSEIVGKNKYIEILSTWTVFFLQKLAKLTTAGTKIFYILYPPSKNYGRYTGSLIPYVARLNTPLRLHLVNIFWVLVRFRVNLAISVRLLKEEGGWPRRIKFGTHNLMYHFDIENKQNPLINEKDMY